MCKMMKITFLLYSQYNVSLSFPAKGGTDYGLIYELL